VQKTIFIVFILSIEEMKKMSCVEEVEEQKMFYAQHEPGTIARVADAAMDGLAKMVGDIMTAKREVAQNVAECGSWIPAELIFNSRDESGIEISAEFTLWHLLPDDFARESVCPKCGCAVSILPEHVEAVKIHQTPEADIITALHVKFECHACETEILGDLIDGQTVLGIKE
jgi:hypothetical protein